MDVDYDAIASLLCSAFEGGSNYWYLIDEFVAPAAFSYRTDKERVYKHIDYPLNLGGRLVITTLDGDEHKGKKRWTLDVARISRGLNAMAKHQPSHFASILDESADAETGDVFLQMCLFGEIVYG